MIYVRSPVDARNQLLSHSNCALKDHESTLLLPLLPSDSSPPFQAGIVSLCFPSSWGSFFVPVLITSTGGSRASCYPGPPFSVLPLLQSDKLSLIRSSSPRVAFHSLRAWGRLLFMSAGNESFHIFSFLETSILSPSQKCCC